MNAPQLVDVISSAKTRVIGTLNFAENSILSLKIPNDTTFLGFFIRMAGSVTTTFASGTPVAKAESIMDSLVNRIDVVLDGQDTIKSLRPHVLHMQQLFTAGIELERFCSAAAAAATDNFPFTAGPFVFGTTGQVSTVRESVYMPFEMVYAEPGMGREKTWLNMKRRNSGELKLITSSFANLLGDGNTAPVVWSGSTIQFEVVGIERQDVGKEVQFDIWKQVQKNISISSETRGLAIDLNPGNYLTGVMMYAKDGAAGSTTTATGKLASNLAITNAEIKINGRQSVQNSSFKALQAWNRAQYGVNAPFASSVSRLDGVAHMNLLSRKDTGSALPLIKPLVDTIQLVLDSNTASNVSYTSPVIVTVVQEEIVKAS